MEEIPSQQGEPQRAAGASGDRSSADRALGPGAVAFLTLGIAAAVSLIAGAGIGYLVDEWAGTSPLFTLIGLGLGLVAAVMMTVTRVRKYL